MKLWRWKKTLAGNEGLKRGAFWIGAAILLGSLAIVCYKWLNGIMYAFYFDWKPSDTRDLYGIFDYLQIQTSTSNFIRNGLLLFFAVVGAILAIWGRFSTEKQLENTKKQLDYTDEQIKSLKEKDRSERFFNAMQMMSVDTVGGNYKFSTRSGLYILQDLIGEHEDECIRCVDAIIEWLRQMQYGEKSHFNSKVAFDIILQEAIRKQQNDEIRRETIREYLDKKGLSTWPDIRGIKLANINFKGYDLQNFDLREIDFANAKMENMNFQGSKLNGAEMSGANLRLSSFRSVRAHDLNLSGANLYCANLQSAIFQAPNLKEAVLNKADLEGISLFSANLINAYLNEVNFQNAVLEHVDLSNAKLVLAGFESATLNHVVFNDADLTSASFENTIFGYVEMENADVTDADFSTSKGLTEEAILSSRWTIRDSGFPSGPPRLPDYLSSDRIKYWLSAPRYIDMTSIKAAAEQHDIEEEEEDNDDDADYQDLPS